MPKQLAMPAHHLLLVLKIDIHTYGLSGAATVQNCRKEGKTKNLTHYIAGHRMALLCLFQTTGNSTLRGSYVNWTNVSLKKGKSKLSNSQKR